MVCKKRWFLFCITPSLILAGKGLALNAPVYQVHTDFHDNNINFVSKAHQMGGVLYGFTTLVKVGPH